MLSKKFISMKVISVMSITNTAAVFSKKSSDKPIVYFTLSSNQQTGNVSG